VAAVLDRDVLDAAGLEAGRAAGAVPVPVVVTGLAVPPIGSGCPPGGDADPVNDGKVGDPPRRPGPPDGSAVAGVDRVVGDPMTGVTELRGVAETGRSIRATRGATGSRAADRTRATTDRRMNRPGHHPRAPSADPEPEPDADGSPARRGAPGPAGSPARRSAPGPAGSPVRRNVSAAAGRA